MNEICLTCKKEFETKDKRQKYCSFDCVYKKNSERNNIIRKQKTGIKYSEDYKRQMSEKLKGRKNYWLEGKLLSENHKEKISLSGKGLKHKWTGFKNPLEESKKRSQRTILSNNPNWQGGKSFEKYSLEWTDDLREAIRKRDNYQCQKCDINQKDLKGKHKQLDVHHINSNKLDCNFGNLITFCKSCHIEEHNRNRTKNKKIDLRKSFVLEMLKIMESDESIIFLTADLGFNILEPIQEKFPERFINVGASEQNMVNMACGLAIAGKKPWCYSGAIFMVMRPYESVRHLAFNNLNVKLIGTGASQFLGWTHNLTGTENEEDLLKNLPNIKRFYPKPEEMEQVILDIYKTNAPCYLRL